MRPKRKHVTYLLDLATARHDVPRIIQLLVRRFTHEREWVMVLKALCVVHQLMRDTPTPRYTTLHALCCSVVASYRCPSHPLSRYSFMDALLQQRTVLERSAFLDGRSLEGMCV